MAKSIDDMGDVHKDARKLVKGELRVDERVVATLGGWMDQGLVVTDRRAFTFKKGHGLLSRQDFTAFDLRSIVGVQLETGLMQGMVVLQLAGQGDRADPDQSPNAIKIGANHFDRARKVAAIVRQQIQSTQDARHATSAPAGPDIADTLQKLGALRDSGVLTEAEFESKKAELLARL